MALLRKTFVVITGLEGRLFCHNIFTIHCTNSMIISNHCRQQYFWSQKVALSFVSSIHTYSEPSGYEDSPGSILNIPYLFKNLSKSRLSDPFFGLFLVISEVGSQIYIANLGKG